MLDVRRIVESEDTSTGWRSTWEHYFSQYGTVSSRVENMEVWALISALGPLDLSDRDPIGVRINKWENKC